MKNLALASAALGASPIVSCASALDKNKTDKLALPININKNSGKRHILGLGGVSLAGGWKYTSEYDALKTLEKAWELGIRYYDTSPRYGNGISERRFGTFLDGKERSDYFLSSKVGRLLHPGDAPQEQIGTLWKNKMNAVFHYDYTAEGARKSIKESLLRLGVTSLDYVFIHDLTPGNLKNDYEKYFSQALKGAVPELQRLKEQGIIKGWGFGINEPDAVLRTLPHAVPDVCLMATQYSLLDHEQALHESFPKLHEKGVKILIGSPLNCGYLAGNETWNYTGKPAPAEMKKKRDRLIEICKKYGVDMRTAALQFCAAHPAVIQVLTGCRNPQQIQENYISLNGGVMLPQDFWAELKQKGIVNKAAPTPV